MKTRFLFPNHFKTVGWVLFVPSLVLGILYNINNEILKSFLKIKVFAIAETQLFNFNSYFKFIENDIIDELILFGLIIGGVFVGFSKLKNEDEYISKIRYESLVWATYFNYGLIIIFTLFFYGFVYLSIVFYNLFFLLLFFIIRFHYMIYKLNKTNQDDE